MVSSGLLSCKSYKDASPSDIIIYMVHLKIDELPYYIHEVEVQYEIPEVIL